MSSLELAKYKAAGILPKTLIKLALILIYSPTLFA